MLAEDDTDFINTRTPQGPELLNSLVACNTMSNILAAQADNEAAGLLDQFKQPIPAQSGVPYNSPTTSKVNKPKPRKPRAPKGPKPKTNAAGAPPRIPYDPKNPPLSKFLSDEYVNSSDDNSDPHFTSEIIATNSNSKSARPTKSSTTTNPTNIDEYAASLAESMAQLSANEAPEAGLEAQDAGERAQEGAADEDVTQSIEEEPGTNDGDDTGEEAEEDAVDGEGEAPRSNRGDSDDSDNESRKSSSSSDKLVSDEVESEGEEGPVCSKYPTTCPTTLIFKKSQPEFPRSRQPTRPPAKSRSGRRHTKELLSTMMI